MVYCSSAHTSDICLEVATHLSHVQTFNHALNSSARPSTQASLNSLDPLSWQRHMADHLRKFDLRHDLGGLAFAKIWGLATFGMYTAACVTLHPGDMVEYTTTSTEQTTVVFGRREAMDGGPSHDSHLAWPNGKVHQRDMSTVYCDIVSTFLRIPQTESSNLCQKIAYAAACVGALSATFDKAIVKLSEDLFHWLAHHTGNDFDVELSLSKRLQKQDALGEDSNAGETAKVGISAREKECLNSNRLQGIWEMCEICGEGMGWYSVQEARCAAGHTYGMEHLFKFD